ncbi:MAG: glycine cleavage T C-terminal barrel domain-containing protein, partial [Pseudomonadota bacterium]
GVLERKANGPRRRFVSLTLDTEAAPAHPGDSVMANGEVVGTVTSANWGHRVGENIAFAFVEPQLPQDVELTILHVTGPTKAVIGQMCRYDPANRLVRS